MASKLRSEVLRLASRRHATAAATVLPVEAMPGPKIWPLVGSIPDLSVRMKVPDTNIVAIQEQYYREFGSIVRQKTGPQAEVVLFHPDDQLALFRSEGAFPDGAVRTTWPVLKYADEKRATAKTEMDRVTWGLVTQGEEWKKWRTMLNTGLFSPQAAEEYFPLLNECSVEISQCFPDHSGDLMKFCNLAVFDIFCAAIIGKSLHVTDANKSKEHYQEFCWSAQKVFHIMGDLLYSPKEKMLAPMMKTAKFKEYEALMETQGKLGKIIIDEVWDSMHPECYLRKLSTKPGMTPELAARVVGDLLGAAVDTTGSTLTWLLYDLAAHPDKQTKLAAELAERFQGGDYDPSGGSPPYLKACYRESMRHSPIGGGGTTHETFKDVVIGGYLIPKGTRINTNTNAIQQDSRYVESPEAYEPERWLPDAVARRKGTEHEVLDHKVMSTPFGFGPRMCLGGRLAKNEIFSLVTRLVQDWEFTVESDYTRKDMKLLLQPDPSPSIRIQPRK